MSKRLDKLVLDERGCNTWMGYAIFSVIIILIVSAIICVSGCISFGSVDMERLDKLADKWKARLEEYLGKDKDGAEQPDKPVAGDIDQLDYSVLQWKYGGFNGANAKLDSPRISNLRTDGKNVYYNWDVGLGGWGLSHGDAGAICAVFFLRDGAWVGGKFDWVSTSRAHRELKHVEYYNNWSSSGVKLPHSGRVAFVVVSANGRYRSNVLVAER